MARLSQENLATRDYDSDDRAVAHAAATAVLAAALFPLQHLSIARLSRGSRRRRGMWSGVASQSRRASLPRIEKAWRSAKRAQLTHA